ncbi:hypothetical protein DV738_g1547, partial [Chaetothyriales sp. CBS 135597]
MSTVLLLLATLMSAGLCGRVTDPNNVPKNAVLLSNVKSLTLRAGQQTASRRVSPVPQLQCVGPAHVCSLYSVDVMRCTNDGSGYGPEDVEWSCKAFLPEEFKLGSTDVSCEGYASSDDPYVLKGSCGVEYRLFLTDKGEEKYGRPRDPPWNGPGNKSEDIVNFLFWVIFLGVLFVIFYDIYKAYRNERRGKTSSSSSRTYTNYGTTPTPSRNAETQQGWRPGFWTGAATGAAAGATAGYMYGNRQQQRPQRESQQWRNGRFFGADGDTSSWDPRPPASSSSSSNPSPPSSNRYESTGFGSTSRR